MSQLDTYETLFVVTAFLFQLLLLGFFGLRRARFAMALRIGPLMYAAALLPAGVSVALLLNGKAWWLWLGGLLALAWAGFGYIIDYAQKIPWRTPIYPRIFFPYITLYLAMLMFLWWPMARFSRALWLAFGVLFVISSVLNATSHQPRQKRNKRQREDPLAD